MTEICIIVAVTQGGAIGRKGDMICHLRGDLRRFKALTMGCPVIMGRRTFQSLPKGALPGRRNIVVSRDPDFHAPGAETFVSLEAAIAACEDSPKAFIIGGGEIYRQAMPFATTLEITHIDLPAPHDADTFFPEIDPVVWQLETLSDPVRDTPDSPSYRFATYKSQLNINKSAQ